jgi:hypothetical protein
MGTGTRGAFGFIIGRKKRLMQVKNDADLLWQILVREFYILMKHFQTKEAMMKAFENIKTTKSIPKQTDIEKFRIYTNLESNTNAAKDWSSILYYCQSSFINILESGYIVNDFNENGLILLMDFNKGTINYYSRDLNGKINNIETASFEEIMNFDEMPTKSYTEIITEMKTSFTDFYEKYLKIEEELQKLKKLKEVAKQQNAANIEEKVNILIDDMNWEKKKLNSSRRFFYYRLKELDLIEEA